MVKTVKTIKTKWLIKGFEGYVFGDDGKLYRLAFTAKNGYDIPARQIKKHKNQNRYDTNRGRLSIKKIETEGLLYLDPDPKIIIYKYPI